MKTSYLLVVLSFFLSSFTIVSLTISSYSFGNEFTVKIKGTSNVHDWESAITQVTGNADIIREAELPIQIKNCEITIPVNSIKSSKGSIMDRKTYNALEKDEHPNITFLLTSFSNSGNNGKEFSADCIGYLTVAGVKKEIFMSLSGQELDNGNIEIWGSQKLKMTSFNIDPPTALLGAMTTGDDITIEYRVELNKE